MKTETVEHKRAKETYKTEYVDNMLVNVSVAEL